METAWHMMDEVQYRINLVKNTQFGGGAWVLRDDTWKVLLHSRRAFVATISRQEVMFQSILWAAQSMHHHKLTRVIFFTKATDLIKAINRPKAWPSFQYHFSECLFGLRKIPFWLVEKEKSQTNRGSTLIAQSVTSEVRLQSYVARSFPFWFRGVFDNERVISSV